MVVFSLVLFCNVCQYFMLLHRLEEVVTVAGVVVTVVGVAVTWMMEETRNVE